MTKIKIILFILITLFLCFIVRGWSHISYIKNPDSFLVLVNKKNKLPKDYIPNDLVPLNKEKKLVRKEVKEKFNKLKKEAEKLDFQITVASAYRDYNYQEKLYNYYIEKMGIKKTEMASAKPGHSEHQTGLAIDVIGSNGDYNLFAESKEFNWLKNNAHLYGFILRYPKNKEHITGFKYEPWHYRYVGIEVATIIYNNNLTLEEYLK